MRYSIIIITLLMISLQGTFAQEGPLKEFTEENPNAKLPRFSKICLYPSTLRMINITQNKDYNELVGDIEKILIYVLDSAFVEATDVYGFVDTYKERGYEEFASVKTNQQSLIILGKDTDNIIGLMNGDGFNSTLLFYMKGRINWQKIPTLMKTLKSNDVVNIFQFRENIN
ncbi:MAG: DUF4252 domain-containing protein [Cyclobacteriaceae bacterium]